MNTIRNIYAHILNNDIFKFNVSVKNRLRIANEQTHLTHHEMF